MKKILLALMFAATSSLFAFDAGAEFTKKCKSCHGAKAEKKALNRSAIINTWDEKKIADALKGYKAKTYGGAMKMTMINLVKKYDDAQMEAFGKYISGLK